MSHKMDLAFCPGMHTPADQGKTLALYRQLGASSVQLYIDWKEVEKTPGVFEWSSYDQEVENLRAYDLKMGPFLIIGPWYVTPQFVRDEPGMVMYRCVEHHRDSAIPSLWCPNIRQHVRRFMRAFADHFLAEDILQFVILGISGDYGEGLYPVVGNGPGAYHGHPGHWCADPLAVADLQRWLRSQYNGSIQELNRAWKTRYGAFEDVLPFIRRDAPSERAYLELIRWYRQSMTDYCDFWMRTTAEIFPGIPAYLCTGGLMLPEHGADFSAQVRVASRTGAGVRVTNEYSDYCTNFMQTRLVNSAGRGYGAFTSHEPAATVTPAGVAGRIFNAVSGGCSQLFSYPGAYIDSTPAIHEGGEVFKRYRRLLVQRKPVVPVAVFYPDADRVLRSAVSLDRFPLALRRVVDFDLVDENMIQDELLDRYTFLIVADAPVMQAGTLERIDSWVKKGGVLFNVNCMVADIEGKEDVWRNLNGFTPQTDRHYGITSQQILKPDLLPRYTQAQPHFATLPNSTIGGYQPSPTPTKGRGEWFLTSV